jgi:phosphopantetheine adenylyltransferase/dephospho-CoA kinase
MTVIGLTGGIASGKSTAAALLKGYGAIVLDADRIGHRVYEPGTSGFQAVVNEFGHDLVAADGTINRQLLGGKVFGDPAQMKRLTDIVWPEIRRLAAEEIADLRRRDDKSIIVLEAAVMIEADWMDLVDEVWIVYVAPEIARERLMTRNGLTEEQAQSRIDSQLSNKERLAYADVKIENSGTQEQFEQKVEREWKRLLKRIEESSDGAQARSDTDSKRQAGRK